MATRDRGLNTCWECGEYVEDCECCDDYEERFADRAIDDAQEEDDEA